MKRRRKVRNFYVVAGHEFFWVRGKNRRVYAFSKQGKSVTNFKAWKRKKVNEIVTIRTERWIIRHRVEVGPDIMEKETKAERKKKIYRSSLVASYLSAGVEIRVWVHTSKKIDESELYDKLDLLAKSSGISAKLISMLENEPYPEINEEIDKDDIAPPEAPLGQWYGMLVFRARGKMYYYKYVDGVFVNCEPFVLVPERSE